MADNKADQEGQFLGAISTKIPNWFFKSFMDLAEDAADAADEKKLLMLYFHQDGCPYCNQLIEHNFTDSATKAKIKSTFNVIEINIWGDRELTNFGGKSYSEKEFSVLHKVQFTPTLLVFDANGKEVLRLNGYLTLPDFNLAVDYLRDGHFKSESYRIFLAKQSQSVSTNKSIISEPDLFIKPPYFLHQSKDSPVLGVFFERKNCADCAFLHQKVLTDPDTRNIIKKMRLVQLDAFSNIKVITPKGEKTTARQWTEKLHINYFPSVVYFDENGMEIIRTESRLKIFHFQSVAQYVYSGDYKKEPEFQRYLSNRADEIRATGKNVNIWK